MHQEFMQEALRLAAENVAHQTEPFGAVVVKDGQIIGSGRNSVTETLDPSAHAEIVAIRDACQNLGHVELVGCELYTSCEPCPMCLSAAYWARIECIHYAATHDDAAAAGFDDKFLYIELAKPMAERRLAMQRLLGEEGKIPFQLWLNNTGGASD